MDWNFTPAPGILPKTQKLIPVKEKAATTDQEQSPLVKNIKTDADMMNMMEQNMMHLTESDQHGYEMYEMFYVKKAADITAPGDHRVLYLSATFLRGNFVN